MTTPLQPIPETDIRELMTPAGGYTRETLAKYGVPWPPPRGWLKELDRRRTAQGMPVKPRESGEVTRVSLESRTALLERKLLDLEKRLEAMESVVRATP